MCISSDRHINVQLVRTSMITLTFTHSIIAILVHDMPFILASLPMDRQVIIFKTTFLYIDPI